jgi:hypothetical protein
MREVEGALRPCDGRQGETVSRDRGAEWEGRNSRSGNRGISRSKPRDTETLCGSLPNFVLEPHSRIGTSNRGSRHAETRIGSAEMDASIADPRNAGGAQPDIGCPVLPGR